MQPAAFRQSSSFVPTVRTEVGKKAFRFSVPATKKGLKLKDLVSLDVCEGCWRFWVEDHLDVLSDPCSFGLVCFSCFSCFIVCFLYSTLFLCAGVSTTSLFLPPVTTRTLQKKRFLISMRLFWWNKIIYKIPQIISTDRYFPLGPKKSIQKKLWKQDYVVVSEPHLYATNTRRAELFAAWQTDGRN